MLKKCLSILLAALLIVSLCTVLAACGDKKADTEATKAPTTAATVAATTAPEATVAPATAADDNDEDEDDDDDEEATEAAATEADDDDENDGEEAATGATTNPDYDGETVLSADEAVAQVLQYTGLGEEGYSGEYSGTIQVPDGSVWHNVSVYNADGELVESYYISDTTGQIRTVAGMGAYANR